jgi:hypothetical protein
MGMVVRRNMNPAPGALPRGFFVFLISIMAKDPAFLFYPGDYVSGTMHLDFECKGAYMDLLMLQFQKDRMSIHMIKHMLGHRFEHVWTHISDKFVEKDGFYYNERLRYEKENRINFCKSRRSNIIGKEDMSSHMKAHMEDEDIDINNSIKRINIAFDDFWDLYDKKVGERSKLEKKWNALKNDDRTSAMRHIPIYKESQPDKQYRKHPATYLNNKSWNDEIIKTNGTHNSTTNRSNKSSGALELAENFAKKLVARGRADIGSQV